MRCPATYETSERRDQTDTHTCHLDVGHSGSHACPRCGQLWDRPTAPEHCDGRGQVDNDVEYDESDYSDLIDRIRSEAAVASRPGQMERLEGIADEVERLRLGAKTLGEVLHHHNMTAVEVTDSEALIDEDGDGDWASVWERLYELKGVRAEHAAALTEIQRLRDNPVARRMKAERDEARAALARVQDEVTRWERRAPDGYPVEPRAIDYAKRIRRALDGVGDDA